MNREVRINFKMHMRQIGSIAYVARQLALALYRQGCNVAITDIPVDWNVTELSTLALPEDLPLLQELASKRVDAADRSWNHVRFTGELDLSDLSPGRNILMYPWDFDPNHGDLKVVNAINSDFDAAWMMSHHTLNAYVNIGVFREKAHFVPHGIDPRCFHPRVTPKPFATNKAFKFLFVGLPIKRKGLDVLVLAFLREFSAEEDVCLIIKTKKVSEGLYRDFLAWMRQIKPEHEQPQILLIMEEEALLGMPSYFAACNCFVFPTRGESFGLALAEAMACAKPVITTRWSGQTDFCHQHNSYLLDYNFTPAENTEIREICVPPGTLWAEPDLEQLRHYMRYVFEHAEEAAKIGQRAGQDMAMNWTWDHAAHVAVEAIERMEASGA